MTESAPPRPNGLDPQPRSAFEAADPHASPTPFAVLAQILTLAALYWALGRAGLSLAHYHDNATLFWPPGGLALAALIVYGWRLWPGIFLGVLALNWGSATPASVSLGIAVGNTLEACLGAILLLRVAHFRPTFERVQDVISFLFIGVLGCTLVSPTIGVSALAIFGDTAIVEPERVWLIWWMGDLGGAIVVAPLLLLARHGSPSWGALARNPEAFLLAVSLMATSALPFSGLLTPERALLASFFPFPFVVWAGTRLGTRGAVLASATITLIAVTGSVLGNGPFVVQETHTSMMLLWSYGAVIGSAALTLSSAIAQRDLAQEQYREGEIERLKIAQRMGQKQRLESLGLLAGGIAHDFNNILTIIVGNTSILRSTLREHAKAQDRLEKITTASKRAAELCEQLLAYAGRGLTHTGIVSLSDVIAETCSLVSGSIPPHVTLVTPMAGQNPIVDGDATQLRQVVMNLLLNAAEAIDEGGGTIELQVSEIELDGETIARLAGASETAPGRFGVMEIRDSGSGMTADIRDQIFDPFFTTKISGRGLGLASVVGILQAHRGGIEVETRPGGGTHFRVYLPLAAEARRQQAVSQTTSRTAPRNCLVLVADDEPEICELASSTLEANGYRVLSAMDGERALALYRDRSDEIDVLLLDVRMPGMSGPEVRKEVRTHDPHIPVILMSAYDAGEVGRSAEPAMFLRKPFSIEELIDQVRQAIEAPASPPGERTS